MKDVGRWACKDDSEIAQIAEEDFPAPFTGARLRNLKDMKKMIGKLHDAGVLGFRRRACSFVGLFTVAKPGKPGQLRLVVDARAANVLHRPPPHADLPTAGAFSNLDWCDETLGREGPLKTLGISVSQLDLTDAFYQFSFEGVGSFFCIEHRVQAREFGVTEVYCDMAERYVEVSGEEWLFPAFRVLPMGWSWSLWLCQGALSHAMAVSELKRRNVCLEEAYVQILTDGRPTPRLRPGVPLLVPYVDNALVIGWCAEDVSIASAALWAEMEIARFCLSS